MAKKKASQKNKNSRKFSALNIILFILLIVAILWIFSYSSMRKSSSLKGELSTYGPVGVGPQLAVISCNTDEDCNNPAQPFCSYEGFCGECMIDANCGDPRNPDCMLMPDGRKYCTHEELV